MKLTNITNLGHFYAPGEFYVYTNPHLPPSEFDYALEGERIYECVEEGCYQLTDWLTGLLVAIAYENDSHKQWEREIKETQDLFLAGTGRM